MSTLENPADTPVDTVDTAEHPTDKAITPPGSERSSGGGSPPPANAKPSPRPTSGPQVLKPRFLATGGEYFGIWIVNILLMAVTLGLYYPWARVRKLQFFAGNTDVGGHRLSFTGIAKQMFTGFALAAVGFILYSVADAFSPVLGLVVIVVFAGVWPWLFRAALRFRLARTTWRGLPLSFTATTRSAYAAFTPAYVAAAVAIGVSLSGALFSVTNADLSSVEMVAASGFGLFILIGLCLVPWLHFRIKRLQHSHFQYAECKSRFTAGVGSFYLLYLKTGLVALLGAVISAITVALFVALTGLAASLDMAEIEVAMGEGVGFVLAAVAAMAIGYFTIWQAVTAYFNRTLHNLVWSNTQGDGFAFAAALKFWPYFGLRVLNLILKMLTMGLYTPFAQVAITRMKLASIALAVDIDLDAMIHQTQNAEVSATADAAADLFDVDIGL